MLPEVNPFSYANYGSSTRSKIGYFINMDNPQDRYFSCSWVCYANIRNNSNSYNPYYYCQVALGSFGEMFNSIRLKLTNIQLDLLSENKFNLLYKKNGGETTQYDTWGYSRNYGIRISKDFTIKDDDEYVSLGAIAYPVFSVKYNEKYSPRSISQLNYYLGITFRNYAIGEIKYEDLTAHNFTDDNKYIVSLLERFENSQDKFKMLLDVSTGKGNNHATSAKKLDVSDWLLIDNYDVVNKIAEKNQWVSQNSFFESLYIAGKEMEKNEQPKVQPVVSEPRKVARVAVRKPNYGPV